MIKNALFAHLRCISEVLTLTVSRCAEDRQDVPATDINDEAYIAEWTAMLAGRVEALRWHDGHRALCDVDAVITQRGDCGFVYDLTRAGAAGEDIRRHVSEVVAILRNEDVDLRARRHPSVWSPLEYGCHLRDMLLVELSQSCCCIS
jgi:hypothetical protein